jgi:RIO kinase 2
MFISVCSFFDRDVECIRRFFRRRFRYESDDYPTFQETMRDLKEMQEEAEKADELFDEDGVSYEDLPPRKRRALLALKGLVRIDELVEASGFGRQLQEELEAVS